MQQLHVSNVPDSYFAGSPLSAADDSLMPAIAIEHDSVHITRRFERF